MNLPTPASSPFAAAAISGHLDTRTAATEVAHDLYDHIGPNCDLLLIFASFHHRAAMAELGKELRNTIGPRVTLGITTESVLGVDQELEGLAGLSAIAFQLPGVELHPFRYEAQHHAGILKSRDAMRSHISLDDRLRSVILLGDPFSTPITRLLPAMTSCGGDEQPVPIMGGMLSGASQPGQNVMIFDDQTSPNGAIGVSISGDIDISMVVSQGCRPIGEPLIITNCQGNIVLELGGRKALDVVQDLTRNLDEDERSLLSGGLLTGMVINEYKDRFGRGDFLVRNMLGYDKKKRAIALGEMPRIGQTMQFHVRDAETADEDLRLLLDAQELKHSPFAAMLFTCNGRGARLFKQQHHDVSVIQDRLGEVPLAGFFAAGEIGPIGDTSFLHGHTAVLALLRGRSGSG
ncbi:MAG: FIST C-terminal domain-containing protein [Planctomycetes bacterium]|nr:FIST C-terminal domain-containing protein [Planctomycetota bacterium]